MIAPKDLTLAQARADQRIAIAGMMQLYSHDFSEQWWDRPIGELNEEGRFDDYPLAPYWSEPDHIPLLIRRGDRLAGFVLVNATSHSGLTVDRNVAEFFVARKHRRDGVGQAAAHAVFDRWPGQWEAAVARRNIGALAFWRRAVAAHPGCTELDELDRDDAHWNGWILRFRIG